MIGQSQIQLFELKWDIPDPLYEIIWGEDLIYLILSMKNNLNETNPFVLFYLLA